MCVCVVGRLLSRSCELSSHSDAASHLSKWMDVIKECRCVCVCVLITKHGHIVHVNAAFIGLHTFCRCPSQHLDWAAFIVMRD